MPAPVAAAYDAYAPDARDYLLKLRELVLEVAARTDGVGRLTETLKWGEPSFLTEKTKSGTTLRLAWKPALPDTAQMLVNCQTSLVESWRDMFGDRLAFSGNRAVLLDIYAPLPADALAPCIAMALTYHRNKRA